MIDRRPTIHVVTEFKRDSKLESYWYECFLDEDFHDFDVNIIDGTFTPHDSYQWSDAYFKSVQLRFILDHVLRNKIKDGDIFIFANAWNYAAIPLSYFRDEFRWNVHLIGFWGDSLFNQDSPTWQRFRGVRKDWGRQVEMSLFNAFDMNCFWSERHWQLFRRKFGYLKGTKKDKWSGQVISKYAITGYPFGYLAKESKVNKEKKENTIVFPYNLRYDVGRSLMQGLKTDLKQYQFVFAQDETNDRLKYQEVLQTAKIMVSTNRSEVDPVLLYEGMLNGVFPLIPDHLIYPDIFPKRYLYPHELSMPHNNKMMYVHRSRYQFERIIIDTIGEYDKSTKQLARDAKRLGDKYYSNDRFIDVLNEVRGRPAKLDTRKAVLKYQKRAKQF